MIKVVYSGVVMLILLWVPWYIAGVFVFLGGFFCNLIPITIFAVLVDWYLGPQTPLVTIVVAGAALAHYLMSELFVRYTTN